MFNLEARQIKEDKMKPVYKNTRQRLSQVFLFLESHKMSLENTVSRILS